MINKESLKRFLKETKLVISKVEDDSSENTEVYKLTLADPIDRIVGSNVTDTGGEMALKAVTTVYVAADDIPKFLTDATEDGDELIYEGKMKLDVSRPKGRMVNGNFTITSPAKAWLTSVAFNRRGSGLQQDRRNALSDAINGFFGTATKAELAAKEEGKTVLNPVDTTKVSG